MKVEVDRQALWISLRRLGAIALFGVLPLVLLGWMASAHKLLFDFHGTIYDGGQAVLHGANPYPTAFLDRLAALARDGRSPSTVFAVPVYPAPTLLAAAPLALLPYWLAAAVFSAASIAAFVAGLWLLGVRDWRCYGAAFLCSPLLQSLWLGQVNGLLVLGVAIAWRCRERLIAPAVAAAAIVTVNLFLWPIGLTLLLMRRFRVAALAVALAVGAVVASWAAIGFAGLTSYPRMLSDLALVEGRVGVSLLSAGLSLGASHAASDAVVFLVTVGLLGLVFVFSRRPGDETRAFGVAVIAGLSSSLVVWPHYLVLLFVPIALLSPTLSPLWLVPLIAYIAPDAQTGGDFWNIAPYLLIELLIVTALCFWGRSELLVRTIKPLFAISWRSAVLGLPRPGTRLSR